jgi:UDP-N-acetylmuramoylalanine--D-glutamate ligase
MICITGSNGKTTTTLLTYHILKSAGLKVGLAGNVGQSLAYQVATCDYEYYVVELSSFQLDNMYDFKADIAVLLNITPDHLDRYDYNMQNYVDSKMRITRNQTSEDAFVFWNDDPIVRKELEKYDIKAKIYPFSEFKGDKSIAYSEEQEYVIEVPTPFNMELEELALRGKHNLYNSLAAGITANIAGVTNEMIRAGLSSFKGVEHRLEKAGRVRSIDFINDSKATNVNACWYALESMTQPTVLILGGLDKGNDYSEIFELVKKKCVGLVFLGVDNSKLHEAFDGFGIPIADVRSMKDCVDECYRMAKPGDCVLLSPCCASFDLFKNMEDRGDQFKECVRNL